MCVVTYAIKMCIVILSVGFLGSPILLVLTGESKVIGDSSQDTFPHSMSL